MDQMLHVESGYAAGRIDRVILIAYTRAFVIADFERLVGYYEASPDKVAVLSATAAGVPIVTSPEVRDEIAKMNTEYGPRTIAAGHVMLGSSLRASVVRSMMTIASMLSWSPVPQRTFSDVAEGAAWIAGSLDRPELGARLEAFLGVLFERASRSREPVPARP